MSLIIDPDLWNDGTEEQWRADALCAQVDPELFFPEKGGSTRGAKKVCGSCEVREQCLAYALANDQRFGIWGGLSERERRQLKPTADGTKHQRAEALRDLVEELSEKGRNGAQIAEQLGISGVHASRIRRELGYRTNRKRKTS